MSIWRDDGTATLYGYWYGYCGYFVSGARLAAMVGIGTVPIQGSKRSHSVPTEVGKDGGGRKGW